MKSFLKYTLLSIWLLCGQYLPAQPRGGADSLTVVSKVKELEKTDIEERIPALSDFDKYKSDKAFDYAENKRPEYPGWLLKIMDWIYDVLGKTASVVFSRNSFIIGITILITVLIIAIILRTQNVSLRSLFGRRKLKDDDIHFYDEDVNRMDFESLILEATQKKNYRMAVRYLYLKNLKALSDKQLISWNPNKTNYSYLSEIQDDNLKDNYWKSTRIFEFVWYGEFVLNDQSFTDAHSYFNEFNRTINNER